MKKILAVAVSSIIITSPFSAEAYQDSYQLTGLGLFGGAQNQDGSIDLRNSTTEQFDPIRGQSVVDRPRPDFAPTPIDVGSFQLFPSASFATYYDSNIYALPNTAKDDVVTKLDPAVSLVSNWNRHALAFTGFADVNTYMTHSEEDFSGGAMQLQGRYDLAPQTWLATNAAYQRDTEPRNSPNAVGNAATPTQFNLTTTGAEFYRGVGMLQTKVNYDFSYYDYDPVDLIGGGLASQNGRDRFQNGVRTELLYDLTENFKPFVRLGVDERDYTADSLRNSSGYRTDIGAKSDLGGITTMEGYIGYIDRNYYHFEDANVGAFDFGAKILWNVTELTSVELETQRTIEETTFGGIDVPTASSSYISSGATLSVTHELQRNILLEGSLGYDNDDFQLSSRVDNAYDVGTGMRYFVNRNIYTDATYDFQRRDSNVDGSSYDRHVVLLRVGVQY
jgi:hypothetical protein